MARTLDASGYTHAEVLACVFSRGAWKPRLRVKVYDLFGQPTSFDPQVHDATIEFDGQRAIHGSLALEMEPIPELLRQPFRYVFAPELGFGPIRGGTAWLPYGRYLWNAPNRNVRFLEAEEDGLEARVTWDVTMGDMMHAYNLSGPGWVQYDVRQSSPLIYGVQGAMMRAGDTDFSQVHGSDVLSLERLTWNIHTGPRARRDIGAAAYAQQLHAYKAAKKKQKRASQHKATKKKHGRHSSKSTKAASTALPDKPKRVVARDQDDRGMRWLNIENVLHDLLGYHPPHRDLVGRYVARPADDPSTVVPSIRYVTDGQSIIAREPEIDPDVAGLANVIYVVAKSTKEKNPRTNVGYANLDQVLPNHPLAPSRCGRVIDDIIEPDTAMTVGACNTLAVRELMSSLLGYETVSVDLATIDPRHEAYEYPSLQIDGDPEFDTPQVCAQASWRIEVGGGTMHLDLSRTYRDVVA